LFVFFVGQILHAQYIGQITNPSCFSTNMVETVSNNTRNCFEITIEFDASVLQPGQSVNIQASNLSTGTQVYTKTCSTSPCSVEWCFTVAPSRYQVDIECWTAASPTMAGGCTLNEGCIIIIDG